MPDLTVPGQQVNLRKFLLKDVDAFVEWQRPGHRWQELDAPYYKSNQGEQELADLNHKLRERIRSADDASPAPLGRMVIADQSTDALIGQVSRYWISEPTQWAAIGIVVFDPANWGKGMGYEALGLWTDYLFTHFPDWVRLDLRTWSGNAGMMRLADKLGYQQEACFRKARIVQGNYYDGLGYGVLRSEWYTTYPQGFGVHLHGTSGS